MARGMMFEIVSREEELGSLHAFVDEPGRGPAALVLEGEAGIGKSTLWLAGVEHARTRGLRVLSSRPAEAERSLAHVGLGDLFEDVLDDVLPALAAPRRRALEVALLRKEESGDPVDHRALAAGVRDVLQMLSDRQPVLIAIDDLQWLDASSASALAFALRRLAENEVLVLLARRLVDGATARALENAAALGTTSESLFERAGVATEALEPALDARVIVREHGTIRFTHPLLSSVLYGDLGEERRSVHGRIAEIVKDPLLRARHLAL